MTKKKDDFLTQWFNLDHPWDGKGDYETLQKVRDYHGSACRSGYEVTAAECRQVLGSEIFTSETADIYTGDVLHYTCSRSYGLVCLNRDQPSGQCQDYEIRFRCSYVGGTLEDPDHNNHNLFPDFDARIYLVLAVVPVLIFLVRLLWVFIFRRRRRQQRRRRREARRRRGEASVGNEDDDDDDDRSINSELARPPPSYQDLFSGEEGSVFAITDGRMRACPKCKDARCSVMQTEESGRQSGQGQGVTENNSPASRVLNLPVSEIPSPSSSLSSFLSSLPPPPTPPPSDEPVPPPPPFPTDEESPNLPSQSEISSERIAASSSEDIPLQSVNDTSDGLTTVRLENETSSSNSTNTSSSDTTDSSPNNPSGSSPQPHPNTNTNSSNPLVLSVSADTGIPADILPPCACACHRTATPSSSSYGVHGYQNHGFSPDSETSPGVHADRGRNQYRGRHVSPLPRPLSDVSIVSQVTLSELPSYEDALKLERKFSEGKK